VSPEEKNVAATTLLKWTQEKCDSLAIKPDTKHKGQHFLVDREIRDRLVAQVPYRPVIEIGPGLGILTRSLVSRGLPITAIEIDRCFGPVLELLTRECSNLRVIFGNALKVDFFQIAQQMQAGPEGVWLVGALPYQLLEPLMLKLARKEEERAVIAGITFLISERSAQEVSKDRPPRGKLSILTSSMFEKTSIETGIDKHCFWPPPRTTSAIVSLRALVPQELVNPPTRFLWQRLFAKPGAKIKNTLREGLIELWRSRESLTIDKKSANRRERKRTKETLRQFRGPAKRVIEEWTLQDTRVRRGIMTKKQARDLIEQLGLDKNLLEKSVEQLNATELKLLDEALFRVFPP